MKFSLIVLISLTALIFSGCGSKEVFKPQHVADEWEYSGRSEIVIKGIAQDAALVEDRKVFAKGKVFDVIIPESKKLLGYSAGWVISSDIDGNLTLQSVSESKSIENFSLKKTVASASVEGDILAVLFADNEMALYSIAEKNLLLKEQGDAPIVVTSKIIKPFFRDDLVIFSTLDGKVVIINAKTKKKLRTIIVSSEKHFNNIIYFDLVDNKIIAATSHKILSLAQEEIRSAHDIRGVVSDDKSIFIATKQGEIISLTPELGQNAKLKFPFAHFLGVILSNDKLYALEKEGYIIEISKDLLTYTVYEVDIDGGYVHIDGKIFFVHDEYISVE
ncbi:hypothetical protein [Sulfurimonas sp.]|uniref:hypothetical protein n=1 Tax=Sulfurimonas sp. TaxID=2022749 RepID=UPI0025EBE220|nr:hypothetical protein [Sulfurimonas sp.]